jgi:ureidoglycolate dehydrogenase (NAD+)
MLQNHYYDHSKLEEWMHAQFEKTLINRDVYSCVIKSVIQTSLRGVDSHGINLFPHYHAISSSGRINQSPNLYFKQLTQSAYILDADHTYGHYAGHLAINKASEISELHGIGLVHVKHSSHFGAAAYFALNAANKNKIAFAFTNADSLVRVPNSKVPFFGTNPICVAAPMSHETPFCLDMATSSIPWNRVKNYRMTNSILPEGVAFDANGIMSVNPHEVAMLAPVGDYKGFGLGMVVDLLVSTLIGEQLGATLEPMYKNIESKRNVSHLFCAIDIQKFVSIESFKSQLTDIVGNIRSMAKISDKISPMCPGDPEKSNERYRLRHGIPISEQDHKLFRRISTTIEDVIL